MAVVRLLANDEPLSRRTSTIRFLEIGQITKTVTSSLI